ncbi:antibiotic biosynthesis monooxygenase family protein [Phenylobacterium montanum]|uniref:Antibiotic biosynthesis monooxygenase n=1 Tax=Phenylobacterium montanum TaxID=2823693 RepID=A0A975G2W9_9CAUL|nr:antibiotic biosynthesis monooxygenase family protein [Caulobacter sp. S6]QUD89572.1 antibiotic biosynthesis monooxygenase [Caulobacter sp. S6]
MPAVIDPTATVFTLVNTFQVDPSSQPKLAAALKTFTEQFATSQPGFIGAAVHMSLDGARVLNYVQWRAKEDLDAALGSQAGQAHLAEVARLALRIDPVPYHVYFVGAEA